MSYQDDDRRDGPPPLPADRNAYDDRDRYAPPQQSGCSKGCLYGLAGCGCFMVLAFIGVVIVGGKAFDFFKSAFSADPAVIRATANEIAEFDPPAGFTPQFRVHAFSNRVVFYFTTDGSMLMLSQLDQAAAGQNQNQQGDFQKGFQEGMQNQKGPRALEIVKAEQRKLKIRGQDVEVTFAEAKDPEHGKEYQQIKGKFKGKGGPAEFLMQIPKEKYKEEDVVKFLESIK